MNPALILPVVDVHAAGEPGRVLLGSHLLVKGATMAQRLEYCRANLEWLRRLCCESPGPTRQPARC